MENLAQQRDEEELETGASCRDSGRHLDIQGSSGLENQMADQRGSLLYGDPANE